MAVDASVSACADAEIFAVAPIGEVVRAFLGWCGVVGDFVGREVCGFADFLGEVVHIGGDFFWRGGDFAVIEICGWLDGELVERDVAVCEGKSLLQACFPVADFLLGEGVD